MPVKPAESKRAISRQVCEFIPPHLVPKLARKHGIKSRGPASDRRRGRPA